MILFKAIKLKLLSILHIIYPISVLCQVDALLKLDEEYQSKEEVINDYINL